MALSFKGHVVVVTGAGGGLGRASVSPSIRNSLTSYELVSRPQVFSAVRFTRRKRCSERFQQGGGTKGRR